MVILDSTKENLLSDFHKFSELYEHLANLHEKTQNLCDEIFKEGVASVKLIDLRLAEVFSLHSIAKVYLSVESDLYHYEISSLLSFWDKAYFQMYLVARDNDLNTSWMYSEVQNYLGQYEIVERMVKSRIQELRELI